MPDGAGLFSLRPECIRLGRIGTPPAAFTSACRPPRFRAKVRDQVFHGANELLRIECADGQVLTLRTSSRPAVDSNGELELEFSPADAVPVRPSEERN